MSVYENTNNNLTSQNNIFENFINFRPIVLRKKLVKAAKKPRKSMDYAKAREENEDYNDLTNNIDSISSLNSSDTETDLFS